MEARSEDFQVAFYKNRLAGLFDKRVIASIDAQRAWTSLFANVNIPAYTPCRHPLSTRV
jgi:hypothetical protein